MSGENELDTAAISEEETRKKIAESKAIDENGKAAAQAAVDAAAKANKEQTPESVTEFESTLNDLAETFRPKGEEFKNEGEALAQEIYLLLSALMAPFRLLMADRDIEGKLKGKFDALKEKIRGSEPLVSVAETPTLEATATAEAVPNNLAAATAETTANPEQDNPADFMPDDTSDVSEGFSDVDDLPEDLDVDEPAAPPVDAATAAMATSPPAVVPGMEEHRAQADAVPVVNTSSGNLESLLNALKKDTQKDAWGIKDFKATHSSVRLELEGGSKMYAKENTEGGLTYSLKRGMKAEARQSAIEKASQMSVDLAGPGATITISPKLPEAQQKAVYEAIQKAMEKPENRAKGLQIQGYTPPVSEILSTTPATTRPRSN